MNKQIQKQLVKKIKEYQNIIIAKHILPDWDAQGSAMGMANIIAENFKNKNIVVVGIRLNDDQTFMIDENQLTDEFISSALLITVDTATTARLDFAKWNLAKEIFKIDHHIEVDKYGTYNMVEVEAMACTQVVTLWAHDMKLKINKAAATNLYTGLLTDSGRFLFPATTKETFQAASILLAAGIELTKIHDYLYVNDLNGKKWLNYAFGKVQISKHGTAIIMIEEKDYQPFGLEYNQVKSALSTMSGIAEIKVWCTVIVWKGENKVSLRARDYDINTIAIKYNGGGHKFASGAKLANLAEAKKLVKDIDNLIIQTDKENK